MTPNRGIGPPWSAFCQITLLWPLVFKIEVVSLSELSEPSLSRRTESRSVELAVVLIQPRLDSRESLRATPRGRSCSWLHGDQPTRDDFRTSREVTWPRNDRKWFARWHDRRQRSSTRSGDKQFRRPKRQTSRLWSSDARSFLPSNYTVVQKMSPFLFHCGFYKRCPISIIHDTFFGHFEHILWWIRGSVC